MLQMCDQEEQVVAETHRLMEEVTARLLLLNKRADEDPRLFCSRQLAAHDGPTHDGCNAVDAASTPLLPDGNFFTRDFLEAESVAMDGLLFLTPHQPYAMGNGQPWSLLPRQPFEQDQGLSGRELDVFNENMFA